MGTIELLLIAWGVVTALLIIAMIYRSALETREGDQIFLDSAGESMAREQRQIVSKIEKLAMPVTGLAILSGALLVAVIGVWLHQAYRNF